MIKDYQQKIYNKKQIYYKITTPKKMISNNFCLLCKSKAYQNLHLTIYLNLKLKNGNKEIPPGRKRNSD